MTCVFLVLVAPPTFCNIYLMKFICRNFLNEETCNLFILYFYKFLMYIGE